MAKRVASALGVEKTKLIKRKKNNNGVLKKVIDYLKSDSYLFAPLFSSDFSPPNSFSSTVAEKPFEENNKKLLEKVREYLRSDCHMYAPLVLHQPPLSSENNETAPQTEKPFEENNKKLLEKVREYLISDCHMYAPLVLHQPPLSSENNEAAPQTGPERAAAATPVENSTEKRKQPAKLTTTIFGECEESDSQPLARTMVRKTLSYHQEAVKHVVHQHCRSSSVPGAALETTGARNVVVE